MTAEEIKQNVVFAEVVRSYGLRPNRSGFVCCPFHQDKTPSMKIYKDHFHCFGCGASGDVFSFVEKIEGCSFQEAFRKLGGEPVKRNPGQVLEAYHRMQDRCRREKVREDLKAEADRLAKRIDRLQTIKDGAEPFSVAWCGAIDLLQVAEYDLEVVTDRLMEEGR